MDIDFKKEVLAIYDDVVNLRRHFHKYPEISRGEFQTAKKIFAELVNLGLEPIYVAETGVYAEIKGDKPGKKLILRADIDALPIQEETDLAFKSVNAGVMHACGHDIHTASLLGAAKILVKYKAFISGVIGLVFQQAEEIGYGAKKFIEAHLLDDVNDAFGCHIASNIKCGEVAAVAGPNNASVDFMKIVIKGKASHISTPEGGIDALSAISEMVVRIKALANGERLLIGIGKLVAGKAYNIIASDAYLEGTIRAFDQVERELTKTQIEAIVQEVSHKYQTTYNVEFVDYTSPLLNTFNSTELAVKVASDVIGVEKVITSRKPSLSGDDMAELINKVGSGVYLYVGTSNDINPNTQLPHHNGKLEIDERSLQIATELYARYAINYLK